MSDVASLSVALHLNSAAFKSQITDAYQTAGQASKKFNNQATTQAGELEKAIARTVAAAKGIGFPAANSDQFTGVTRGAGQLNYVLHEVAAGSNVASSSIINALIPAVHTLKGELDGSAGGWKAQQDAARRAAAELADSAQNQIAAAQAEKQAALGKVAIAEKTIAAAQAQREQAIVLDEYYTKQAAVNKQYGVNVSYQEQHLKNERAILEANRLEAAALEKLKTAKAAVTAAELAETGGKTALIASTEAAAAANTQLSISQRIAATSSRALGSALRLLGGVPGIALTALAAGGTYLYSEFKKAEEQTKKLTAAALDLNTSALVTANDLKRLNGKLGDTENSVDAVTASAKAGFSGKMLTDVATLANAYAEAGGSAQDLVNSLTALRGDPVAAMQKLTAQGVALSDTTIQQVIALNKSGDAAQASQIIIEAALEASRARAKELGFEVDKTTESVNNLGNTFSGMGLQATKAMIDSSLYQKKLQADVDSASARYIAASQAGWAKAENTRLKNAADLKSYMDAGTSAAEKRAEAIKKLNNSIYKSDTQEYKRILKGINEEYDKALKREQPKKSKATGESEGQRALDQAQQRNAILREQALTTNKLTSSESQLAAFNEKIANLKGQHLTADQKSLVNMQDQIRSQLQINAGLEKEANLRKLSEKYEAEQIKWREEAEAMQREASLGLNKYNMSDREAEDAEARNAIINRFEQRRITLEKDFTDTSSSEYQKRVTELENAKQRELKIVEDTSQKKLAAEQNFGAGFNKGLNNWLDSASSYATQSADLVSNTMSGFVDNLSGALAGNKVSWQDWSNSVLQSLQKIMLNAMLVNSIKSMGGTGFLNFFGGGSGGGSTPSGAYDNAAAGFKFNAKGGVYNSPSLNAYSGGIYNSPQVFAFAKGAGVFGEAGPEAIMPLTRAANGTLGVRALSDGDSIDGGSGGDPVIHQIINQHFNVSGNGDAALKQAMQEAARQGAVDGAKKARQDILSDFQTNGQARRMLGV